MNASTTDGPARSAIAAAVRTKRPAPMIAADAEGDEIHRPERTFQTVFADIPRLCHQLIDRLSCE